MAINRKVLINYHSSGHTAPDAENVYQGELVVAHETGKETIFTKNNANEMVPFISCAQTIAIINSKIQASDTDVMVKAGEKHLEVSAGTGDEANKFTLNTVDVQSEEEFKAYSAATKIRIDDVYSAETALTAIVSALTDVVLTGITGDTIITATPANTGDTGSNAYNLTHREGHETSGFKKLTTDAYGHVTAATPVATADIQALGFKTSAETGDDLAELSASVVTNKTNISELSAGTLADIEALSGSVISYVNELSAGTLQLSADTHNKIVEVYGSATDYADAAIASAIEALDSTISADTGKYFTALAIEDGKLVAKEEADIPTLSTESTGDGNVVTEITTNGHEITYVLGATVATSEDLEKLSAATIALSAGTLADIETLSGDVINYVNAVSGDIETVINELSGGTQADLNALSAGTIADNNKLSADVITYINTISGYAHGEIAELSASVVANETDIDNLSAATLDLSGVTLTGVSLNNTPLAVNDHIVSVPVTTSGSGIANATESGSVADALAVKEYVQNTVSSAVEYKGATADEPTGTPVKGDLWIASAPFEIDGQNVETGDFIIYDGENWQVIEKNLDGAITGSLTEDTVTLGDSTNSVKSLANGAQGTVLTIGSAGTPVWANDPELSVVSAGTGNVISDITVSDHEITFTKGVTAADAAALETLSGATEAISGFAATQIEQLSAGTIMVSGFAHGEIAELSGAVMANEDAIDKLSAGTIALVAASATSVFSSAKTYTDEQITALSALTDEAIVAAIQALDSSTATTDANHYLTAITIEDGKITSMGEAAIPAGIPISATTATPVNTASAVLTGVTASGADNHELTFGMSNKVFSAVTSDSAISAVSAITAESALTAAALTGNITSGQVTDIVAGIQNTKVNSATTSESADTAAKVANKLTLTDGTSNVEYDGSAAQTVTFGTNTAAGNSMSMTNGVVDVDIIDCGTY